MKKLIFTSFVILACVPGAYAQAVIADPAVNFMRTASTAAVPVDPFHIPIDSVIELKVPVINYNQLNALPSGSCKIKIGLGSRMILAPGFDLGTIHTSNYFNWTSEMNGGQLQITGDLRAGMPGNFADTVTFRVKGSVLGTSTITTNFLVTNHNTVINLSDENGTNNNASLAYTVVEVTGGPLPVTFTKIITVKEACAVAVDFYTENEINVNRFEIQVSKNGIQYETAGTLAASNAGHYRFKFDLNDHIASGQLFVRIKSIDLDGQYQYSDVSRVSGKCDEKKKSPIVFPNPTPASSSYFTVRSEAGLFNGHYTVSVIDMSGKLVSKKEINVVNTNQFKYYPGFITAGQYIINIREKKSKDILTVNWEKQ